MLRFQKDLRPHLSYSYRFRPSTYNTVSVLKTLLYPQCACSNELDACVIQYIGPRNWCEIEATWLVSVRHFGYSRLSGLAPGRVNTSPFSDSIVFFVYIRKLSVFKKHRFLSLHSGERFLMAPFSVIVFGVAVWTIAVSGAKQFRFLLKTD